MVAGAQAAQVQLGVVPAHPVEQLRQFGGGARGDEELGPARPGSRSPGRAAAPSAPAGPARGGPAGSATSITSKDRPTGSSTAAPGTSPQASVDLVEGGAGRDRRRAKARGGRPARRSRRRAAGAGAAAPRAARAPGTTSQPHRPVYSATAVHSDVRPRRRAPDRIPVPRLPPIVKPMPPPTGRDAPVVTTLRAADPALRCRIRAAPWLPSSGAPGAPGGARGARPRVHRSARLPVVRVK